MNLTRVKTKSLSDIARESIYEYIMSMHPEDNSKLPREEILARDLGVSRITVRKALNDLAQEGMILRIHGKGTFINPEALQMNATLDPAQDFEHIITSSGYDAEVKLIDFKIEPAKDCEVEKLKADPNDLIVYIEKAFYANGNLVILSKERFSKANIDMNISPEDFRASAFELINNKSDKKLTCYKTELSTVFNIANNKITSSLNLEEPKAFLACNSIYFDQHNEPLVFSTMYIDTDFIKINVIKQKI